MGKFNDQSLTTTLLTVEKKSAVLENARGQADKQLPINLTTKCRDWWRNYSQSWPQIRTPSAPKIRALWDHIAQRYALSKKTPHELEQNKKDTTENPRKALCLDRGANRPPKTVYLVQLSSPGMSGDSKHLLHISDCFGHPEKASKIGYWS